MGNNQIDWLGCVVRETEQVSIDMKVTPSGQIIGYSARCLIHGDWYDITAQQAAVVNSPEQFCTACQAGKPERDWRKPSAFVQGLLDAISCGTPMKIEVSTNDAIGFSVPERIISRN